VPIGFVCPRQNHGCSDSRRQRAVIWHRGHTPIISIILIRLMSRINRRTADRSCWIDLVSIGFLNADHLQSWPAAPGWYIRAAQNLGRREQYKGENSNELGACRLLTFVGAVTTDAAAAAAGNKLNDRVCASP